ncbi:MAG TPA: WD40 repeat domain-containing protein, partial [Ktedonobacterales bacterium]|nr:WD40 repeat domain-containing protein [Ktedonobacterales bacterium]
TSEELYQVPAPGTRRRGKKRATPRRYPGESDSNEKPKVSTREQELIAPPSAPFDADISRRDLLRRAGQGAIIVGLGAAALFGAKIAWDRVSGAIGGQRRQLPTHITLPEPFNLTGHSGDVQALDWGTGTTKLASGAANDGAIRIWDIHNPQQPNATLSAPDTTHGITSLSWGRDGRTLFAAVAQANAEIWDTRQQTPIGHVPYPVQVGQWQPAQDILALVSWTSQATEAAGGQAVIVWDIASAKTISSLKGPTDKIQALAWSPLGPGMMVAAGGRDNTIFVWSGKDAASMALINTGLKGHSAPITAIDWSSQDVHVVSGSADGTARVWDVNQPGNGTLLQQGSGAIGAVAWSPVFPLVAIGDAGGNVALWDVDNRRRLSQVAVGSGAVLALAWSSDGHYLAAGSANHTVYVWDTSHF